MSKADQQGAATQKQLQDDFAIYDEHVDVVSSFEWIFTQSSRAGMSDTVRHFERYPRVVGAGGTHLTPDFTVLFTDDSAIIAEIAQFANVDNSVDKLCRQLGQYATVTRVQEGRGRTVKAARVDVMYLVPMRLGNTAYDRVIGDRYHDPEHPFSPPGPPCIVQYAREESGYTLQRLRADRNGTLPAGDRNPDIQTWLDGDFKPTLREVLRFKSRGRLSTIRFRRCTWRPCCGPKCGRTSMELEATTSSSRRISRRSSCRSGTGMPARVT